MANVDAAYAQLKDYWENKFAQLQIKTPNEGMNTLINTWNLYQAEVNIMFSRFASFIEVGGRTGLGYRDTAQDAMTIPHSNPEKCRQRIVELLRGLTTKGYGLHLFSPEWFDPDAKKEKKKPFKSPTVIPTVNAKDIVHGWRCARCEYYSARVIFFISRVLLRESRRISYERHLQPCTKSLGSCREPSEIPAFFFFFDGVKHPARNRFSRSLVVSLRSS